MENKMTFVVQVSGFTLHNDYDDRGTKAIEVVWINATPDILEIAKQLEEIYCGRCRITIENLDNDPSLVKSGVVS